MPHLPTCLLIVEWIGHGDDSYTWLKNAHVHNYNPKSDAKGLNTYLSDQLTKKDEDAKVRIGLLPHELSGTAVILDGSAGFIYGEVKTACDVPGVRDVAANGSHGYLCGLENSYVMVTDMDKLKAGVEAARQKKSQEWLNKFDGGSGALKRAPADKENTDPQSKYKRKKKAARSAYATRFSAKQPGQLMPENC